MLNMKETAKFWSFDHIVIFLTILFCHVNNCHVNNKTKICEKNIFIEAIVYFYTKYV